MTIYKILIFLILVWCSVCIFACAPLSNKGDVPTTPTPAPSATIQATPTPGVRGRWLAGIPCAPPCWEGITPGVTTFTETLEIIETLPGTSDIKIISNDDLIALVADWTMPGDRAGIQQMYLPFL